MLQVSSNPDTKLDRKIKNDAVRNAVPGSWIKPENPRYLGVVPSSDWKQAEQSKWWQGRFISFVERMSDLRCPESRLTEVAKQGRKLLDHCRMLF